MRSNIIADVEHNEKVNAWAAESKGLGIKEWAATPVIWKLLWKAGVKIPPPYFLSTIKYILFTGFFLEIIFIPMSFALPILDPWLFNVEILFLCVGLLTIFSRMQVRNFEMPSWENYPAIKVRKK